MPEEVSTKKSGAVPYSDPAALLAIKNLELRAKIVVEGLWNGLHRSPFHGSSVEFTEYRHYASGDDLRYLDWRLYGRSDRFYLKKFRDETNLRCYILADLSPSMNYGSRGHTKADYARTIAATLGYFLHQQGDAVGLLTFDDVVRDYFPARNRRSHLRQLIVALEKSSSAKATNIHEPLQRALELVRKRSLFVIVSDFLTPAKSLEEKLPLFAACGHEVALFHVVDPAELSMDIGQAALFEDAETGKTLFINPVQARERYKQRFEEHVSHLKRICSATGQGFYRAATDHPLETPLLEFLRARLSTKSSSTRRR